MVQCKKCKLFVSKTKDEVVRCKGSCESIFHKKCAQAIKSLVETEFCNECQMKECGNDTTHFAASPAGIPTGTKSSAAGDGSVLAEINRKLDILFTMKKTLDDIVESVDFYAEQYQTLIKFKEKSEKKITALEQRNIYIEKCFKALEERITQLEYKEK